MNKTLKVKILKKNAVAPCAAHPGTDLGYDLYASEEVVIKLGEQMVVHTGIALGFPEGFGGIIKDRSSMASKKIYTSAGVIDNGYQGEIKVLLRNEGMSPFYLVLAGEKIAQLILTEVHTVSKVLIVDTFEASERGDKGFGSSGK